MTETLLLYAFAAAALAGAVVMLIARHPMRVAIALIGTMLSLAGIYALLGVHVIAVFHVLIYVGAVMVFMVYVIMLLDVRDPSFVRRFGHMLVPGVIAGLLMVGALAFTAMRPGSTVAPATQPDVNYRIQPFSVEFLHTYWLHFELTSVLLVAAVVAAIAVIKGGRRNDG